MNKNLIGLKLVNYQGEEMEVLSYYEKFNMYQIKETFKNGIVSTSSLLTEEDIERLINAQNKILEDIQKYNDRIKKLEQKEQEEQEKYNNVYGYCDNMKPHQKAKVLVTLNKAVRYNNKNMTRKEYIKELLEDGYAPFVIDKMLSSSRKINLERIETYKYDVPAMQKGNEFYTITKTEYNYALYLQNTLQPA